jgi:hypothetical protein
LSVLERFDILARLIDAAKSGPPEADLTAEISDSADVGPTRVRSLELLGQELGFLERNAAGFHSTSTGAKFANYIAAHRSEVPESGTTEAHVFQICTTMPPSWQEAFRAAFGGLILNTEAAERQVVEAAQRRLLIVAAFLDPDVLQLKLQGIHRPHVSVVVLTSDPRLAQRFPDGNWRLRRLFEVLGRRFADISVFHFARDGMIVHAKLWVSEGAFFLTSANVSGNSAADNMEVGIYSADPALSRTLGMVVDTALEMEGVEQLRP